MKLTKIIFTSIISYLLLTGLLIFFISCNDNDDYSEQSAGIVVKHISYNELVKKESFNHIINKLKKEFSKKLEKSGVVSTDNAFLIHTDFIYQTTLDSITNYTFVIERPGVEEQKVENLILTTNTNNDNIDVHILEIDTENNNNFQIYSIDVNNIPVDTLIARKIVYIYGEAVNVPECVIVTYLPCNGVGNDDGHAPTSNCDGSATVLSYAECTAGGGNSNYNGNDNYNNSNDNNNGG